MKNKPIYTNSSSGKSDEEKNQISPSLEPSVYDPCEVLEYKQSSYPYEAILDKKNNSGPWRNCHDIVLEYFEFDIHENRTKRYTYKTFGYKPKESVSIATRKIEYISSLT